MQNPACDNDEARVRTLLAEAASGDQAAWRRLVDLFADRVFALARSRVGCSVLAEEITQSVFVTVASKIAAGQYNEQGRFEAWLFRIAMNRVRDEIRRVRRHAEPVDPSAFQSMPEAAPDRAPSGGDEEGELERLRAALATLGEADQEVIQLRHHAQLSFKQMAELLDEPVGTLLARHHRALAKLRATLEADGRASARKGAAL